MVNILEIPRTGVYKYHELWKRVTQKWFHFPLFFYFTRGIVRSFCSCIHSSVIIKISWNARESFLKWQMDHLLTNLIRSTKCRKTHDLHNKHLIFSFIDGWQFLQNLLFTPLSSQASRLYLWNFSSASCSDIQVVDRKLLYTPFVFSPFR